MTLMMILRMSIPTGWIIHQQNCSLGQREEGGDGHGRVYLHLHVVWWLQGYLGVKGPVNDLQAIQQMMMYRKLVADT